MNHHQWEKIPQWKLSMDNRETLSVYVYIEFNSNMHNVMFYYFVNWKVFSWHPAWRWWCRERKIREERRKCDFSHGLLQCARSIIETSLTIVSLQRLSTLIPLFADSRRIIIISIIVNVIFVHIFSSSSSSLRLLFSRIKIPSSDSSTSKTERELREKLFQCWKVHLKLSLLLLMFDFMSAASPFKDCALKSAQD